MSEAAPAPQSSLRELLGGTKEPEFELRLLPGWERHSPDEADRAAMDAALKKRFMSINRPELHASMRTQLDQAYALMKQQQVKAYFAATAETDSLAIIPGAIVATTFHADGGGTLDTHVAAIIRDHGAKPLFGDKRFIRYERESTKTAQGDEPVVATTIVYMTPVPGSKRRRGLQLTATIARPLDMAATDEKFLAWKLALDVCVSTLRWMPA
ncbi:protein TPRXL [Nocardioides sp. NBC_00850]|uniref:protein TPRXL n=1 Tax=Nocardioides sp. NBC_00850 TaxID=2976001 RepID=UPI00386E7843|nr:protein TPRXL [Nocardioides sp. NBC_00850]